MRNRTRKEAAKIMAEEEEAKKPKIIPHWKKSYYENLQKMKELDEEEDKEENPEEENATAEDDHIDVQTDEDIEEELDKFKESPKRILKRDSSVYSDIPEDVVQESHDQEIEEEIEEANDMTTVKLHINYEKGCSVNELAEVLQSQWHSNFKDYSIERLKNGQDFDLFSVSLKVPKTILPEHYFVYKGRKPSDRRFRNLVLLEQESF